MPLATTGAPWDGHVVTIRYGIIGTGMMGVEHIHNIRALPEATVTAIADPHQPSLDTGAAACDGPVAQFHDFRSLLHSGLCDAVVVATPNMTHLDVLTEVLATDLAVLIEKPLSITVDECRQLVSLGQDRRALTWVGLEYRYIPSIAILIDHVRTGMVGDVQMVAIREHRFPFLPKVGDWNRSTANTGGTLVEKCCHFFDLMVLLTGSPPVRVYATGSQAVNRIEPGELGPAGDMLDNAFVLVDHESGARSMLDLCMFAEASLNQEELSVVGTEGKVEALVPEHVLRIGRRGREQLGAVHVHEVGVDRSIPHHGYHYGSSYVEHQRFLEALRTGNPPEVSLTDGLMSVAIGQAAHLSITEGRPIAMEEVL